MAKSVRPCRVRQQPPEVRCWILTGLHARSASLFVNGTERSAANLKIMSSNRLNRVMRVRALSASLECSPWLSVLPRASAPR